MGAFVVIWSSLAGLFMLPALSLADTCNHARVDEQAEVAKVFDGDTLLLKDGRKIRFIGINTPEMARDERPAQAFAEAATAQLASIVAASPRIGLVYGAQRKDRYGRTLAHLYTGQGQNIEQLLLTAGLAATIAVPPNIGMVECYLALENQARQAKLGMWSGADYNAIPVDRLPPAALGFMFISGTITRLGEGKRSLWLNFDRNVTLRVAKKDLPYFGGNDPRSWVNRKVIARGWLVQYKKQKVMQIRHPASLQLLN